ALGEALLLVHLVDRQPVLVEQDAVVDQQLLEHRRLFQEQLVLVGGTEAHHLLDAGAVVPAAVEQHQLARRRQVRGIALEVPLRHFALARLRQCDDAHLARVQPLGDGVDHATLAGGVAALEQDHHPLAGVRQPVREVVQLELERLERLLVLLLLHRLHRLHRLLPLQACWTSSSPRASDTASAHISANNAMTATSPNSWSTTPNTPAASITPP